MKKIGILPCSGACNVGMMSTKAVVTACKEKENVGFVCALGLPLGIEGIIANARKFDKNVAVNGCEMRCATKSLEKAGLKVDEEVILTKDFGIKKTKDFTDENRLADVTAKILELSETLAGSESNTKPSK